jgi:hypothetical protein
MVNGEAEEINAIIQKNEKDDCSQHALCHCLCHGSNVPRPIANHAVACCYICEKCKQNVIFDGVK